MKGKTDDLRKLDDAMFAMAARDMSDSQPPPGLEDKLADALRARPAEAEIIDVAPAAERAGDERKPRRLTLKVKYLMAACALAAACLAALVMMKPGEAQKVGDLDYRRGVASVIRSGDHLGAKDADQLETGDALETADGVMAASLDGRVQLLVNRDSRLFVAAPNRIDLSSGETWLYVRPGSGHYAVGVGEASVNVVGTSFGVKRREGGVIVKVSAGKILYKRGEREVAVGAGEAYFFPESAEASSARKLEGGSMENPPGWVEEIMKEISQERLKLFFPSAAPIAEKN